MGWEPEQPEQEWSDDESWRGDQHRREGAWSADAYLTDWPEESAGPEYWLFKRWRDRDGS